MPVKRALFAVLLMCLLFASSACSAPGKKAAAGTAAAAPSPAPAFSANEPGDPDEYYVVSAGQRKGVVNGQGKAVLPMQFARIDIVSQGYRLSGSAPAGRPVAFFAVPADETLAGGSADRRGMLYGADGQPLNGQKYVGVSWDDSPYIQVSVTEGEEAWETGLADYHGNTVIPVLYGQIFEYSGGFIAAKGFPNDAMRAVDIYDAQGRLVRSGTVGFRNVLGDVIIAADESGKLGFMDDRFQWKAAPRWDEATMEAGGVYVMAAGKKYVAVRSDGTPVLPGEYYEINVSPKRDGDEEYMITASGGGKVYLFDGNGNQLFESDQYARLEYSGGILLATDADSKMQALNLNGTELTPPARFIYLVSDVLVLESPSGDSGGNSYYTRDGKKLNLPAVDHQCLNADRFISSVKSGDTILFGLDDGRGRTILACKYSHLYAAGTGGLLVFGTLYGGTEKFGLMDTDGRVALPARYDSLYSGSGRLLYATAGPVHGLIDMKGDWVWYTCDYDLLED